MGEALGANSASECPQGSDTQSFLEPRDLGIQEFISTWEEGRFVNACCCLVISPWIVGLKGSHVLWLAMYDCIRRYYVAVHLNKSWGLLISALKIPERFILSLSRSYGRWQNAFGFILFPLQVWVKPLYLMHGKAGPLPAICTKSYPNFVPTFFKSQGQEDVFIQVNTSNFTCMHWW